MQTSTDSEPPQRPELSPADFERVEQLADVGLLRVELKQALSELPKEQAVAIKLRIIDDLPYREIANQMSSSEGAARVRVSRGLTTLSDRLEQT